MNIEAWLGPIVSGVLALLGVAFGAYIKESARSVVKRQLEETLRGELAIFKEALLHMIDGAYQRSSMCKVLEEATNLRIAELQRQVVTNREDIQSIRFGLEARAIAEERGG